MVVIRCGISPDKISMRTGMALPIVTHNNSYSILITFLIYVQAEALVERVLQTFEGQTLFANKRKRFSANEIATLKEMRGRKTPAIQIARKLLRTEKSVCGQLQHSRLFLFHFVFFSCSFRLHIIIFFLKFYR